MEKKKQQLDDDGSMEKNKEKLYDDRTAINKKEQIDSMTRGYDAQKLKGYGGSAIPVIGESFIRCEYNNIYKDVKYYIVESSSKTALGLKSFQDFKLVKIMDEIKY